MVNGLICPLFVKCKVCGQEREHGLFFRHGKSFSAGTNLIRTCTICSEFRKITGKTFEEYESIRFYKYKRQKLKAQGLTLCHECSNTFPIGLLVNNKKQCPACRTVARIASSKAELEGRRWKRWGVSCDEDYQQAKLNHRLERLKLSLLAKRSTSKAKWDGWAYQHWLKNASNKEISTVFYKLGRAWLNPKLNGAEKYRVRYRLDNEFNAKQKLRRQLNKKAKNDGVAELIRSAINNNGFSNKAESLLGYSIKDLTQHLENLFIDDMNWNEFRRGSIHIDHIKPQRLFNLSDDKQWQACWSLSNLQPLWAVDNLKKSGKYDDI